MNKILLKNGTLILPETTVNKDILIRGETISDIDTDLHSKPGTEVVDCAGKLIFPGILDPHTHMGIPIKDGISADNFETGTRSAIHGGVTTIIDFTILEEDQTLFESVEKRLKLAEYSYSDYSLHCNITRFSKKLFNEIPKLIQSGIISFKVFTTYEEVGIMFTYEQIEEVAKIIAEHRGLLMVHAEDNRIIQNAFKPLISRNLTEPLYHPLSRPDTAEATAVERMVNISIQTGCPIYIVHLSSAKGLKWAQHQEKVFVETCPQYLLLDDRVYHQDDGRMFVTSPPHRKTENIKALWQGIINGNIQTIGTDHCPFLISDKEVGIPFQNIPNGMGGVETLFPVMLAQFIQKGLDLSLLSRLLSTNAAKLFGIYPRKGALIPNADADLVVVDPHKVSTDWFNDLVSVTDWNAFVQFPAIFPEHVFRRGDWLVKNGELSLSSRGIFLAGDALSSHHL
ncbi:MAG: amidohydrolase family protein [Candidatus Marinimicrobia bacterium]|nr:amidohydrolase family protein [Candidatus Neomarinimicrobiota bacterium]